ncbi:hypothetical protein [Desulfovibrio sp. TomC]|uniref:hypothetical protein n=1 Tax=Desulfovibrio sp. TomC TaxID=1562888 RepID=UPI0012E0F2E5|nr:hypothetical protein [Desulfovibrio sp. TomC]
MNNKNVLEKINNALGSALKTSTAKNIEEIEINSAAEVYWWLNIILLNDQYKTHKGYSLLLQHVLRRLWSLCGDIERYALLPTFLCLFGIVNNIKNSSMTENDIVKLLSNCLRINPAEVVNVVNSNAHSIKH